MISRIHRWLLGAFLWGALWAGWTAENPHQIPQPVCLLTNSYMPAFSPDAKQLVYVSTKSKQWVEIMDLAAKTNRVLIEDALRPEWSPDGQWIAYQQVRNVMGVGAQGYLTFMETFVVPARGGRPKFIFPGTHPHWSADGRLCVVEESSGRIYACKVDKPEDQPPVWWTLARNQKGQISPDGGKVAVLTNENLAVFSREKKEMEFLIPLSANRYVDFTWGHDSQYLVVALLSPDPGIHVSGGVWWVDLKAAKIYPLAKGEWGHVAVPAQGGPMVAGYLDNNGWYLWLFPKEWLEARRAGRVPVFELNISEKADR